ncbi:MAG: ShlB/FhaC/HecB family hemolysin secretion/activation protein [Sphingobium sp.]|uniref:ShlB/FhaC/HecB family hemolysin secretion/activation protein n=2 Tax=Sphingobium sp. TaxID=1912891 RepID=UPI003BB192B0
MTRWMLLLGAALAVPDALAQSAADPAAPIDRIMIVGSSMALRVEAAAAPYRGRPTSEAVLRDLAERLASIYARSDIAIYTISAESAGPGMVEIAVAEGRIERLQLEGDAPPLAHARARRIAAPLLAQQPLRKTALRRAVRLIGDLTGVAAQADLIAGAAPDALVLRLRLTRRPTQFVARIDNGGASALGRTHGQLSARFANLLTGGDQAELLYDHALDGDSSAAGISYALPVGTKGLALALSASKAQGSFYQALFRVRTQALSLGMSYPLVAGEQSLLVASASLDAQQSDTFLLDYPLIIERTRIARAGLGWSRATARTSAFASAALAVALDLPGARVTGEIADTRFAKLRVNLGYDRMIARDAALRARLVAQLSRDRLTSAEMLQLGGADFGRAFEPGWVGGDSGAAASVELGWAPQRLQGRRQVELIGYLDGGQVHYRDRTLFPARTYRLASAGAGARISEGGLQCDLMMSRALHDPFAQTNRPWRLTVRVSLRFP